MPQVTLPEPMPIDTKLLSAIMDRRSFREFSKTQPLSLVELSSVLAYSFAAIDPADEDGMFHHYYPSGGAKYPLECYVVLSRDTDELVAGLYHYNCVAHTLERLLPDEKTRTYIDAALTYEFSKDAPCSFWITAVWQRSFTKYNDLGYSHTLIEVGHVSQNVLLLAEALGIGACSLAGFRYEETCEFLDIDGIQEAPLHVIALGRVL